MTTTSEKILSEMERMGRMKIKDLCAQIGWQYQKFRRRIKANDFIIGKVQPELQNQDLFHTVNSF